MMSIHSSIQCNVDSFNPHLPQVFLKPNLVFLISLLASLYNHLMDFHLVQVQKMYVYMHLRI